MINCKTHWIISRCFVTMLNWKGINKAFFWGQVDSDSGPQYLENTGNSLINKVNGGRPFPVHNLSLFHDPLRCHPTFPLCAGYINSCMSMTEVSPSCLGKARLYLSVTEDWKRQRIREVNSSGWLIFPAIPPVPPVTLISLCLLWEQISSWFPDRTKTGSFDNPGLESDLWPSKNICWNALLLGRTS